MIEVDRHLSDAETLTRALCTSRLPLAVTSLATVRQYVAFAVIAAGAPGLQGRALERADRIARALERLDILAAEVAEESARELTEARERVRRAEAAKVEAQRASDERRGEIEALHHRAIQSAIAALNADDVEGARAALTETSELPPSEWDETRAMRAEVEEEIARWKL